MKTKSVGIYVTLGIVCVCCVVAGIAGLFLIFPLGGNNQTCAVAEIKTCTSNIFGDATYLTYYVTNTCGYKLNYVKVIYTISSISGDLLYDDVAYIEGLNPGEGKGAALTIPDPNGHNYSCNAVVVEEGK